jgi:hypothetical protein
MKLLLSLLILFWEFTSALQAQVVTTEPEFPTDGEPVTIYFDASQGTGALEGHNGDIYAHTGLITSESVDNSDWQYAPTWGDNSDKYKLERS